MKKFIFFSFVLFSIIILNNCSKSPVFPDTPEISLKEISNPHGNGDSLIITLNFKDGDGDLGLSSADINSPYEAYDIAKDSSGNVIPYGSKAGLPSCLCIGTNYDTLYYDSDNKIDTLLLAANPNHNNYYIDFLIKQTNGTYLSYDFSPLGLSYNARFPRLSTDKGPIQGELNYTINLAGDLPPSMPLYQSDFKGKYIKFRIYIKDRALHSSNTIETPDILINY